MEFKKLAGELEKLGLSPSLMAEAFVFLIL